MGNASKFNPFRRHGDTAPETPVTPPITAPMAAAAPLQRAPQRLTPAQNLPPTAPTLPSAIPAGQCPAAAMKAQPLRAPGAPNPSLPAAKPHAPHTVRATPATLPRKAVSGPGDHFGFDNIIHRHLVLTTDGTLYRSHTSTIDATLAHRVDDAIATIIRDAAQHGYPTPHRPPIMLSDDDLRAIKPRDRLMPAESQQAATGKGDGRHFSDAVHEHMVLTASGDLYRSATSLNDPALKRKVDAAITSLVAEARNQGRRQPRIHEHPVDVGYLKQIKPMSATTASASGSAAVGLTNVLQAYGLNEHQEHIADWVRQGVAIGASDIEYRCEDGVGYMRVKWHGAMSPDIETIHDPAYATKIRASAFNLGSGTGNVGSFSEVGYHYRRIPGSVITDLPPGKILDGIRATFMYNNTGDYDGTMQLRLFSREGDGLRSLESQGWNVDAHLPLLRSIQALSGGLVPFCGEVGHGKSTALAALLVARFVLRGQTDKMMTIQDLIEIPLRLNGKKISEDYQLPVSATGASVREIMEELLAFVHRANPSTLMVNEAKDSSVWAGILRCLLNGTTTFTTNHAVNALMSPYKFRNLQSDDQHIFEPELFPAIAAQRLVPVVCEQCGLSFADAQRRRTVPGIDDLRSRISLAFGDPIPGTIPLPPLDEILDRIHFTNPDGCEHCRPRITSSWAPYLHNHMSGTKGRTVIGEIAMTNRKIMRSLRNGDMIGARKNWINDGGNPMQRHALHKIANGLVDPREVEKLFGDLDRFTLLTTDDDDPDAPLH